MDLKQMRANAEAGRDAARRLLESVKSPAAKAHAREAVAQAERVIVQVMAMERKANQMRTILSRKAEAAEDFARCMGKAARARTALGRERALEAAEHHRERLRLLGVMEGLVKHGRRSEGQTPPSDADGGGPTD
ncbi:MAG: hypothetical protein ACOYOH_28720 [Paracraurococcus sp.]